MSTIAKIIDADIIENVNRLRQMIINKGRTHTPDQRRDIENFVCDICNKIADAPDYDHAKEAF